MENGRSLPSFWHGKHRQCGTASYTLETDLYLETFSRPIAITMATARAYCLCLGPSSSTWPLKRDFSLVLWKHRFIDSVAVFEYHKQNCALLLLLTAKLLFGVWRPLSAGAAQRIWAAPFGLGAYGTSRWDGTCSSFLVWPLHWRENYSHGGK